LTDGAGHGFRTIRVGQQQSGAGRAVVDLQRGVIDLVGAAEQYFEIPADIVAVSGGVDQDVRR